MYSVLPNLSPSDRYVEPASMLGKTHIYPKTQNTQPQNWSLPKTSAYILGRCLTQKLFFGTRLTPFFHLTGTLTAGGTWRTTAATHLFGGGRHAGLDDDDRAGDVLLLHPLAVRLDGLDADLRLLGEEHKHLVYSRTHTQAGRYIWWRLPTS